MGDVGRGFYVRPGIPALMRDRVVPAAQLITPNQFELEALTGRPTGTTAELLAAADAARALGPETVLVTSVVLADADPDTIAMVAVDGSGAWSVATPRLPRTLHRCRRPDRRGVPGPSAARSRPADRAGRDRPPPSSACSGSPSSPGESELALVQAQEELVQPIAALPGHPAALTRPADSDVYPRYLSLSPRNLWVSVTDCWIYAGNCERGSVGGRCPGAQSRKTSMLAPRALSRLARSS